MKRIFSSVIIPGIILMASGCTDWLDVRPESEIVLEDYWQNESQVNQALAACYRSLTENDCMSRMLVWGELRSDNVTFGNDIPTDMYKMLNVDISPSNSFAHWGIFYTVINYCNSFLHYAPGVVDKDQNFTESKLRSLEAEVLTIRALAYFYLVRAFRDVPWVEEPSIDDTQEYNIPKSSEDIILEKLIADLTTALTYARDKFDSDEYNKGRITRNAVRALLADIYLWTEDYSNTVEMCNQIINDNTQNLELVPGEKVLDEVFYTGNSSESIFELQFANDDKHFNHTISDYYGGGNNFFGYWSFPAVLVTGDARLFRYPTSTGLESEEDLREKDFLNQETGGDRYFVFKYSGWFRFLDEKSESNLYIYRSTTANWIVYRLPDIILMKAEALIQLGTNFSEALDLINLTYMRSNTGLKSVPLSLENYNSKLEIENLLLRERQRELMFEGKRWFDLMRLARRAGSPTPLLNYVMKKYTGNATIQLSKMSVMDALYMPIHTDELKANTALDQNPFYELSGEGNDNQ